LFGNHASYDVHDLALDENMFSVGLYCMHSHKISVIT
jgi:hypothetical protein